MDETTGGRNVKRGDQTGAGGEASSASIHEKNITISPSRVTTKSILLSAQLYKRVKLSLIRRTFLLFSFHIVGLILILDILTTNLITK